MLNIGDNPLAKNIFVIYLLNFLFTIHFTLPIYVNSTFLNQFVTEDFVGIIYTISSILAIVALVNIHEPIRKQGIYRTIASLTIVEFLTLIGMAVFQSIFFIVPIFILNFVLLLLISFNLDLFMEAFSTDSDTGKTRGWFLTSANAAWFIAPAIAGLILTNGDYWKIYLSAAILVFPVIYLLNHNLKDFKDPEYPKMDFWQSLKDTLHQRELDDVLSAHFLLQIFFAWGVIYLPIYLHQHIGFSWQLIGIMFTIIMVPYVLIEEPLGELADKHFGEKEILIAGFAIIAIPTIIIAFMTTDSFWLWTIVLLLARFGASMVEAMSETYFFKKVNNSNIYKIGTFRILRPLAYVFTPLIVTLLLVFTDLRYTFVTLGILMLYGMKYGLTLKDTR